MSCSSTCNIAHHVAALHCADTEATAVSSASASASASGWHAAVDPHPHSHPHSHPHPLPRICSVASCRSAANVAMSDPAAAMADAIAPPFSPCAQAAGKLLAPPSLSSPLSASLSAALPMSLSTPSLAAPSSPALPAPCLSTSPSAPLLDRVPTALTSLPEFPPLFAEPPLPSLSPPSPPSPRAEPLQAPQPPAQLPVNPKQLSVKSGKSAKSWSAAVTIGVGSSLGVAAMAGVRFAGYGSAQPSSLFDLFSSLGVPLDIRMLEACALSLWHLSAALSLPLPLPIPILSSSSPSLDLSLNLLLLLLLTALCAAGAALLLPPSAQSSSSSATSAPHGERRSARRACGERIGGGGCGGEAVLRGSSSEVSAAAEAVETAVQLAGRGAEGASAAEIGGAWRAAAVGAGGSSDGAGWWWGSGWWWWRVTVDATAGAGEKGEAQLHEGSGGGGAAAAAAAVTEAATRVTRVLGNLSIEVPETFFLSAPRQPSPSAASPRVSSPFFTAHSLSLSPRAALLSPLATCAASDAAAAASAAAASPGAADDEAASASAASAAAAAAAAFMESDSGEVNSGDLADLILHLDWSYDDGLGRWDSIIDRANDDVQYQAWRRDPKDGGPTEYHTLTRFPSVPAHLVAAYYTDCAFQLQHQCDPVLKAFAPLSACAVTGVHKGRFERKYPLCAAREYVLAWKVWEMWGESGAGRGARVGGEQEEGVRGVEGGEVVFCVTKAVEDAGVPRKSKPKRVDVYNCGWRVQDVVLPDGRVVAEIEMVVRDDCGIQRDMAKMAFRRGAWGYVCNTLAHIRTYMRLHPHLLEAHAQPLVEAGMEQGQQQQQQKEQVQQQLQVQEQEEEQQGAVFSSNGGGGTSSSRIAEQERVFPAPSAAAGEAPQAAAATAAAMASAVAAPAEASALSVFSSLSSGAAQAGAVVKQSLAVQPSLSRLLLLTPRHSLTCAFNRIRSAAAATAMGSKGLFAATPAPASASSSAALSAASAPVASVARTAEGKRVLLLRGVVPTVAVAAMGLGVGGLLVVHYGAAGAASKFLLACTLRSMWMGAQRESPEEGTKAGRKVIGAR
ncbi:hypothetical protein CLOP_g23499 [Closterium sp. NIES-67]|nr:hypothetical protein CLOP_g23499 [Closterium sp. NIES-67]